MFTFLLVVVKNGSADGMSATCSVLRRFSWLSQLRHLISRVLEQVTIHLMDDCLCSIQNTIKEIYSNGVVNHH
jgi:hypothetical protein